MYRGLRNGIPSVLQKRWHTTLSMVRSHDNCGCMISGGGSPSMLRIRRRIATPPRRQAYSPTNPIEGVRQAVQQGRAGSSCGKLAGGRSGLLKRRGYSRLLQALFNAPECSGSLFPVSLGRRHADAVQECSGRDQCPVPQGWIALGPGGRPPHPVLEICIRPPVRIQSDSAAHLLGHEGSHRLVGLWSSSVVLHRERPPPRIMKVRQLMSRRMHQRRPTLVRTESDPLVVRLIQAQRTARKGGKPNL